MLKKLALALASVVVVALGFELALWLLDFRPRLSSEFYLQYRARDPDTIVTRPRFLEEGYFRSTGAAQTVIALGDSFTEGFPVSTRDSYPAVLDRLLQDAGCDVQVVNAGLGDSGPGQHLNLLTSRVLPALDPDVLVWSFYANDVWDVEARPVYRLSEEGQLESIPATRSWLYRRQLVDDLAPLPEAVKRQSRLWAVVLKSIERLAGAQSRAPLAPGAQKRAVRKISLLIDEMNRLSERHGFEAYYLNIAPEALYLRRAGEHGPEDWESTLDSHRALDEMLRRHPRFIAATFDRNDIFSTGPREDSEIGRRHYNELGYRLLAQRVFEAIRGRLGCTSKLP